MSLDWSIGLHAICVRVELDIKTAAPKKGYLLEFTAFISHPFLKALFIHQLMSFSISEKG
jgi:hypothetical protein